MEINKSISLNGNIVINDEVVAYLSASINTSGWNMSINTNVVKKDVLDANVELAEAQYEQFELEVKATAAEFGYSIFGTAITA